MRRRSVERHCLSNPLVYLDISIAEIPIGRLIFELFNDVTPKTAENFRQLCTGEAGTSPRSGKPLHYKGTRFHAIKRGYLAFGGALDTSDPDKELKGESIYGECFPDENFEMMHDDRGKLATLGIGPNSNSSLFTISFVPTRGRNGNSVVFGQLIAGFGVLRELEITQPASGFDYEPVLESVIWDCGELENTVDLRTLIAYPEDEGCPFPTFLFDYETPKGVSEIKANLNAATEIKAFANTLYKAGSWFQASERYRQGLRYLDTSDFKSVDGIDVESWEQVASLSNILQLNRAMALIQCDRALEAKLCCDQVLMCSKDNAKALLRRGQAYMKLDELDLASADLKAALNLLPRSLDIREALKICTQLRREAKSKNAFTKWIDRIEK